MFWVLPGSFTAILVCPGDGTAILHGHASHGRIHYHVCGGGIPWRHTSIATGAGGNSSAQPGRTELIHLLSSTRQQTQAVTHPSTNQGQCCSTCRIWLRILYAMLSYYWPCNASWEHFMSRNIYYMSHTIDKWNLYCSYTIKCIFAGIRISQFDRTKQNRTKAPLFQRDADENQEC